MNLGLGPQAQAEHITPLIPSYFSIAHLDYLQAGHSQVGPASNSNLMLPYVSMVVGKAMSVVGAWWEAMAMWELGKR